MEPNDRSLFPGALEMMILQTLRRQPQHGYALAQSIQRNSDIYFKWNEGSLYPALQRMLKAGWVSAEWGISPTNRKVRIYRITTVGRKQLERKVSSFQKMLDGIARAMKAVQS